MPFRKRTGAAFLASTLALALLGSGEAELSARTVRLENGRIAVEIEAQTGALKSVRDQELGVTRAFRGIPFTVSTDRGVWKPARASHREGSPLSQEFEFSGEGFTATLHYEMGREDRFLEKWLEIRRTDQAAFFLTELVMEDVELGGGFQEIHFHDDQTPWHDPINLFLRTERGGCYAGIEYPYWEKKLRGTSGFRLGYAPNYPVAAGEPFVSQKFFLGVYHNESIYRYAHGPFPGPLPPPWLTFNDASVSHFGATRDVPPEVLDWGEVWAMQEFMRQVLPRHQLPEDGYWAWVNAWWSWAYTGARLTTADLDLMRDSGIHDVMTQEMWFGHSQHPQMPEYVARFDPAAPPDFHATPGIEALHAYGEQIGVHVTSFVSPPISFIRRPEWLSRNANGTPTTYIQGVKASCPACDDYMDYLQRLYLQIFDRYQPRWWGFDGRWTSFREIPYEDGRGIEPDPCFAEIHGHLPGDNRYREFRNITRLLAELRRRHPRMCLETYYGLKRVENWVARDLNATENYYESNGSDLDRFQQWHNQNGRFLPPDRNYCAVFGRTPEAFRHSFIACLAGGPYCQVGAGLPQLKDPATRAFFTKWREWGGRNHEYLEVKRDLFPTFGYSPVDGSAHILQDRGFVFLFPTGLQPNTHAPGNDDGIEARVRGRTGVLRAVMPLNHWIGLRDDPKLRVKITEIYPRENRRLGVYRHGRNFTCDLPAGSAMILQLDPAAAGEPEADAAFDPAVPADRVRVVKAFEEGVFTPARFLKLTDPERAAVFLNSGRLKP